MTNKLELNEYKQGVANLYNQRSESYDNSDWHVQICHRLLEYSQVSYGQTILDIGTGTGHLAFAAAQVVEDRGKVFGIDISAGMLKQAQNKANALKVNNIEFQLLDAESLDYPINHFDRILCANTFPWMENKKDTLSLWCSFLKSGGRIGIHTPADTAYIGAVLLRKVLARHGVSLEASNRIGSIEQCVNLFTSAGFEGIEIKTEKHGSYTSLEKAKAAWSGTIVHPSSISLKIYSNELSKLSPVKLAQVKAEFDTELEALETKEGIWDEIVTWYILGHKP
ncbi:MAG: class I SAM-dependent methyltransferase [Pleurocapsa sp. MO_192.B19]|nr:class I SAM-dependent methyltransferase [Pleurocapsa sp. MO_192.B19]